MRHPVAAPGGARRWATWLTADNTGEVDRRARRTHGDDARGRADVLWLCAVMRYGVLRPDRWRHPHHATSVPLSALMSAMVTGGRSDSTVGMASRKARASSDCSPPARSWVCTSSACRSIAVIAATERAAISV